MLLGWVAADMNQIRVPGVGGRASGARGQVPEAVVGIVLLAPETRPLTPALSYRRSTVRDDAHDVCVGNELAIDFSFTPHTLHARTYAQRRDFQC